MVKVCTGSRRWVDRGRMKLFDGLITGQQQMITGIMRFMSIVVRTFDLMIAVWMSREFLQRLFLNA